MITSDACFYSFKQWNEKIQSLSEPAFDFSQTHELFHSQVGYFLRFQFQWKHTTGNIVNVLFYKWLIWISKGLIENWKNRCGAIFRYWVRNKWTNRFRKRERRRNTHTAHSKSLPFEFIVQILLLCDEISFSFHHSIVCICINFILIKLLLRTSIFIHLMLFYFTSSSITLAIYFHKYHVLFYYCNVEFNGLLAQNRSCFIFVRRATYLDDMIHIEKY